MAEFLAWKSDSALFGTGDESSERFHRPWPDDAPMELVETSYFGFSIPEAGINAEIYHWAHPVFGLTSGGIFITQGVQSNVLDAAYVKWANYMPMPEDMTDCTYANGMTVRMVRPGQEWEVSFDDPAASTSLQVRFTAIMPLAFRPVGGHFTQAMRTSGTLVLRGVTHRIDGFTSRDRSWGDRRSEEKVDVPPASWSVPVFSEDLAFHVFAFESPELNPALARRYPGYEDGKNHMWGYVWKDGELRGVRTSRLHTEFGVRGVGPSKIELEVVDETDEVHQLTGVVEATIPFAIWPTLPAFWSLTKWSYRGLTGYGDTQNGVYEKYLIENRTD
jgi:hypothetical protein